MPRVTFIQPDGASRIVAIRSGLSLMSAAVMNDVPGIVATCGGQRICGTCHVYVDAAWTRKTGAPAPGEVGMLASLLRPQPTSRLSCQIKLSADLDGLIVRIPEVQG